MQHHAVHGTYLAGNDFEQRGFAPSLRSDDGDIAAVKGHNRIGECDAVIR